MAKERNEHGRAKGPKPRPDAKPANKQNVVKASSKGNLKRFYALLGVVAAIGAVFITYQAMQPKAQAGTVDPSIPLPKAQGYLLGDSTAPVQVIEFADFECPACGNFATITEPDVRKRLIETGKISYRFIDFPLPMHSNTWQASNAAACANEQGKFWEMHDQIFANQDRWDGIATSRPKGVLKALADSAGLDVAKWEECYDARKYNLNIVANQKEGERRLIGQTPTFIIGSKILPGSLSFDTFKAYVDTALMAVGPAAKDSAQAGASK